MMPATPETLTVPSALALGLLYGMGPCLLGCLPFLGPVYLGLDGGFARSISILVPVSLGRLSAYIGLGLASALVGHMAGEVISPKLVGVLSGGGTFLIGMSLFLRGKNGACANGGCAVHPMMPGGLFLMGYALALSPCGPLTAILLAAAVSQDPIVGSSLGLSFGIGAIAAPALVFGIGAAYVTQQLRAKLGQARRYAELASAALLSASGLFNLLQWGF